MATAGSHFWRNLLEKSKVSGEDTAAYEVDYFEAVAGFECGFWPCGSWGYGAVVLDGDAVAFETEFGDELIQRGRVGERVEGAGVAVQRESEGHDTLKPSRRLEC
jgi:hypothetical protein